MKIRLGELRRLIQEALMNEDVSVEHGDSPLQYDRDPNVKRISLVDTSSPEYKKWDTYFAPSKKSVFYGPSGRKLKKPKYEDVPGAAPGTVAFLDYHLLPGGLGVYVDYVKTRSDMRGQGHAAKLIDELVKKFGEDARYDFGKIMSPTMGKLQKKLQDRGIEVLGWHDY